MNENDKLREAILAYQGVLAEHSRLVRLCKNIGGAPGAFFLPTDKYYAIWARVDRSGSEVYIQVYLALSSSLIKWLSGQTT